VKIEKADVEDYAVYLKDKYRPPSRGGNKRAWHQHVLTIGGETYSFLAAWSGKFVFKGETVSFAWEWNETQKYRNVDAVTVVAFDKAGNEKWRGERAGKPWRTATTRAPGQ
jgi:hypothetical protein